MIKRRSNTLMIWCVLALTILVGCTTNDASQSKVMARVGTTQITEAQFINYLEQNATNIQGALQSPQFTEDSVRQYLFSQLLGEEIALSEARRNGYGITPDTTRKVYNALKWQTTSFANLPKTTEDPNAPPLDFTSSSDYQEYLLRSNALDAWASKVNLPGAPESYDLEAIIIDAQNRSPEEAMAKANDAMKKLQAGAPFSSVAQEFSESSSAAQDGGRIGFIPFDPADPATLPLLEALRATPFGQVTQPINIGQVVVIAKPLAKATYASWFQFLGQGGMNYLEEKRQEYAAKGDLEIFVDPINVPLPAAIKK